MSKFEDDLASLVAKWRSRRRSYKPHLQARNEGFSKAAEELDALLRTHADALKAVAADARRYRWLRENCYISRCDGREFPHAVIAVCLGPDERGDWINWMHPGHTPGVGVPTLDAAIDAAQGASNEA